MNIKGVQAKNTARVAVVTDSAADLPPEIQRQLGIRVVPVHIHFEEQTYRDGVNITNAEAYRMLAKRPEQFKTSPATIGEYLQVYQEEASRAAGILVITLSSKLSTMYNVASLAREQLKGIFPNVPVEILDSGTVIAGEGLVVTAAARAAIEGGSLDQVTRMARMVKDRVKTLGVIDTLKYAYRTGRIPEMPARIGSMLSIKPIFSIAEGSVHILGFCRNRQRGLDRIIEGVKKEVGQRRIHLAIGHVDSPDTGAQLYSRIQSEFRCVEHWLTEASPVIGYSTGPGMLALAYYVHSEECIGAQL